MSEPREHPLARVSPRGWKATNLHRLLTSHGFDTSQPNGRCGHFFVRYGSEPVRNGDGRPLIMVGRGSQTVSTGTAHAVLKA
ncbi:MAG TPA: hypothetical protein VJH24_01780, partial [Candidatus Bilamarchaeaceae archaeon]|nr:hypothetical protein [Candidatus Bilamarchaeaceae archaeon]